MKRLKRQRSFDSRVLTEMSMLRSTLQRLKIVVPDEWALALERDVRALDELIPKLRERKRV
jgi:hypothetical protein